jgi:predicted permease
VTNDRARHDVDRSARWFRALLALYPREFRDQYGREVVLVFKDRYRDASSPWERAVVWIEAAGGVLQEAPREHMHMLLQDLRFAVRLAMRTPAFTITAILTLALGIGANGAIFQLIDAVGLQPLPVATPRELAEIQIAGGNGGFGLNPGTYGGLTRPIWQELATHQKAFSNLAAWSVNDVRVGERSALKRQHAMFVSGDFFRVLNVAAYRGRLIEPADEQSSCPTSTAVVSYDYWRSELASRDLAGGDVRLKIDLQDHQIVGVTPPGFTGITVGERFDIALPLCRPKQVRRDVFSVSVIGRLRPGWDLTRASKHLDSLSPGVFEATAPTGYSARSIEQFKSFRLRAASFAHGASALRSEYAQSLRVLLAIAALVLVLAAANLANLLLARASSREREMAVRLALGASRPKLLRQLLTESLLLAGIGAALSVLLAANLSHALVWALGTSSSTPTLSLVTNWRVLLFTAVIACGTWIIFGVAPALRATRLDPAEAMKRGGRSLTQGGGRLTTQRLMVVMQVTASLVLLVAALLFVRSFWKLVTLDPGLRREGITIAFMGYSDLQLPAEQLNDFQRQLVDEIRTLPGTINASTTTNIPLLGSSWEHGLQIGSADFSAKFTWVGPSYFETMGMRIVEGRGFSTSDRASSTRVAVVNEAFARRAGRKPIGMTLRTSPEPGFPATAYEVVGIVPDSKYSNLRDSTPPMVFAPDSQYPGLGPWSVVLMHSSIAPATAATTLKQYLGKAHPEAVIETTVLQQAVADRLVRDRLLAMLAGFFGVLAAVLAMVGLYGMISFAVANRRQEIGIRIALGADRVDVIGMMMREAGRLVAVGVVVGVLVSLLAGRAAASLLFDLVPHDPITLAAASLLLGFVAAFASYLPARSASRLNPLDALRQQ